MKYDIMTVFGVCIDDFTRKEIVVQMEEYLHSDTYHQIATINPEFLLRARKNEQFKHVLNGCDLRIPDGVGIKVAGFILEIKHHFKDYFTQSVHSCLIPHKRQLNVYPGIDLMWKALSIANDDHLSVFLVANRDGLSKWKETAHSIKEKFPNLTIDGIDIDPNSADEIDRIILSPYHLVFCNFGAPQQEYFLSTLRDVKMSSIRLTIGIGGSFDYISGNIKRAPQWMQKYGFEWLFRLIKQPLRIGRILRAVILFPLLTFFTSTQNNDK